MPTHPETTVSRELVTTVLPCRTNAACSVLGTGSHMVVHGTNKCRLAMVGSPSFELDAPQSHCLQEGNSLFFFCLLKRWVWQKRLLGHSLGAHVGDAVCYPSTVQGAVMYNITQLQVTLDLGWKPVVAEARDRLG